LKEILACSLVFLPGLWTLACLLLKVRIEILCERVTEVRGFLFAEAGVIGVRRTVEQANAFCIPKGAVWLMFASARPMKIEVDIFCDAESRRSALDRDLAALADARFARMWTLGDEPRRKPPRRARAEDTWPTVLEISPSSGEKEIRAAWRRLAAREHPDAGGSNDAMARINAARDQALAAVGAARR
jgi:hypothetical protein